MVATNLEALLPVGFVVGLGWLVARFGIIGKTSAPMFADFVVRVPLPLARPGGALNIAPAATEDRLCRRSGGDKIRIES
jgi:hypothetical protein